MFRKLISTLKTEAVGPSKILVTSNKDAGHQTPEPTLDFYHSVTCGPFLGNELANTLPRRY
jgi:hypothetical protein